jgi:2-oxoglutarate dehydrogenase E2 component (dihydrolipoamide succinyltransferase)
MFCVCQGQREGEKMKVDIKIPSVGESITEATIGDWVKKTGEFVKRDEIILLLETDKASVELVAPNDGVLTTTAKQGEVVKIGTVVASIDTEGVASAGMPQPAKNVERAAAAAGGASAAVVSSSQGGQNSGSSQSSGDILLSPAVRRIVDEKGLDPASVRGTGRDGRLTKSDVESASASGQTAGRAVGGLGATSQSDISAISPMAAVAVSGAPQKAKPSAIPPLPKAKSGVTGGIRRVPMTTIRKKIAERLLHSQNTNATLTTFNEIDMTQVLSLREKYKEKYKERYGVSLGFMGFFVKAAIQALKEVPEVNAWIEGTDIVYHDYFNIGVAVGTEKGLIVPVVRDADQLSIAEVEMAIKHYATKARDGKISIDDLSQGTFTISNGGVYGSLMATPILNPPQSGILGMHKIEDRPIAMNGQVVIRPMMYIAFSYDHRLIDGKEAVTFLLRVKENIEDPQRLLLEI